jgi:hypothetical protein
MNQDQEREANELTSVLRSVTLHSGVAARPEIREPLLDLATKVLKTVDGTTKDDLAIAITNLEEV